MTGRIQPRPGPGLQLHVHPEQLSVCHLAPDSPVPAWAMSDPFYAITRTKDELSIVCEFGVAPPEVECVGPWSCLEVEGPLDFSLTGILASIVVPLAEAGISVFALSAYRTDYVLVPAEKLEAAERVLLTAGHRIR